MVDWTQAIYTALIVVGLEAAVIIPLGVWFAVYWVRTRLPDLILELIEDKEFVKSLGAVITKMGPSMMPNISWQKALGYGLMTMFQRWTSGQALIPKPPQPGPILPEQPP